MKYLLVLVVGVLAAIGLAGCDSPDQRVADMAQQFTKEQARQNQRVAEGQRAIAKGTEQLVAADAKARQDLVHLQRDLRQDQADVGKQRDKLEDERKLIASQRQSESRAGAFYVGAAIFVACLAPLVLAGCALLGLWRAPTPEEEGTILVEELALSLDQESRHSSTSLPANPHPVLPGCSDQLSSSES
jgi:hypothetical protein